MKTANSLPLCVAKKNFKQFNELMSSFIHQYGGQTTPMTDQCHFSDGFNEMETLSSSIS